MRQHHIDDLSVPEPEPLDGELLRHLQQVHGIWPASGQPELRHGTWRPYTNAHLQLWHVRDHETGLGPNDPGPIATEPQVRSPRWPWQR